MKNAAKLLEFEHAAYLRDRIEKLQSGKIERTSAPSGDRKA